MKLIEHTDATYWADYKPNALIRWSTKGDDVIHARIGQRRVDVFVTVCDMPPNVTRRLQHAGDGVGSRHWRDGFCLRLWGQKFLLVARLA